MTAPVQVAYPDGHIAARIVKITRPCGHLERCSVSTLRYLTPEQANQVLTKQVRLAKRAILRQPCWQCEAGI